MAGPGRDFPPFAMLIALRKHVVTWSRADVNVNEVYESGEERKSARNNGEQDARSSECRRAKRRNGYGYGLLGIADVVS
ncbi:hypothetical protein HPB47_025951 [Ixodes persulcatus]|uniref:Uncharacterized protein n=1 Tax=Ixodes persulcatus TaxID=34615 RepID=A0AC60Q028_IXOPE|nr:hypothetical protein HPB47_025951 [Ixodes persulcatus]